MNESRPILDFNKRWVPHLARVTFVWILLVAACTSPQPAGLPPAPPAASLLAPRVSPTAPASLPAPAVRVTRDVPATTTATPTAPAATATATITATPDPYAAYSIDSLSSRSYGGGQVQIQETLAENNYFRRELISYPSDGLEIYGFMDVPKKGTPPYPVVIALHGYIDPSIYDTIDYTTRYADALARAGFLVLHPNLRGYAPSDSGDNLFRVGMAVDVLNLIAIVKQQGGQPGPLELGDPQAIGLWGHSMGGGVTTRVLTISPDVRAAVLYGAMSGDDQKNYERIFSYFSNGDRGQEELKTPPQEFERISPIYFLDRIQAAVSIHHGKEDPDVPLAWSIDLCQRLKKLDKEVECFTYAGQGHTFHGEGDELFMQRMIDFFNHKLR